MDIVNFLSCIEKGGHRENEYFARVIMVSNPSEIVPEWISSANQPFPFIIGPETVAQLIGKSTWEIMEFIGYESSFVKEKIAQGQRFFIVFFTGFQFGDHGSKEREPLIATWSNLLSLIQETSPICGKKCASVYDVVQTTHYDQFNFGYEFESIPPEVYWEVCSFEAFENSTLPTTPGLVRAFLRHTMKCTRLYSGDGYCYDEQGNRGAKEYLIPRVRISSLINASEVFPIYL